MSISFLNPTFYSSGFRDMKLDLKDPFGTTFTNFLFVFFLFYFFVLFWLLV